MEDSQETFLVSDQALESLRQMAATVTELSAAVASINQSIERFDHSHPLHVFLERFILTQL
jgi:hypothetical protein